MKNVDQIVADKILSIGEKKELAHQIGFCLIVRDDEIISIKRKCRVPQTEIDALAVYANYMGYVIDIQKENIKLSYGKFNVNVFFVPGRGWTAEHLTSLIYLDDEVRFVNRKLFKKAFSIKDMKIIQVYFGIASFHEREWYRSAVDCIVKHKKELGFIQAADLV